MKQLTKEQHEAISEWLTKNVGCTTTKAFEKDFPPSCCDSCAEGEECESDYKPMATDEEIKKQVVSIKYPDQRSEFDDNIAIEKKYYVTKKGYPIDNIYPEKARAVFTEGQVNIDRKPEESAAEYMDRVATINGRK